MEYLIPRLLCSFLSGCLISQSGSLIQLSSRNILASPSTLGIDGLTILWLLIFHSLSLTLSLDGSLWGILLGIPFFALISFAFCSIISRSLRLERVIFLGITFNLLVGAIFSLWQFFFLAFNLPFPIEVWFGHFRYANQEALYLLLLTQVVLSFAYFYFRRDLTLFSLGRAIAGNLKLNERRLFLFLFLAAIFSTYIVVFLFGAFSFLGLIFPILARKLWFKSMDLKGEIIWGSVFNGCALMLIDFICYYFPIYGAEVPVGLLVTAVGAVSLILLLWQSNRAELLAKPFK